ncbi:hypothetical protein Sxan_06780 [Streptomyces xanthophaeus]|uniref:(2Fe-2S)-binding protein n=1 Tax=Streptomyces xanthophaeus TaxID=67385 RepID=A0A919LGE9_9ACTN|nr:hypothetical protein Sxan_06780 [Streptomyces xanthophaeus]
MTRGTDRPAEDDAAASGPRAADGGTATTPATRTTLRVNGTEHVLHLDNRVTLLDALRGHLT